VKLYKEINVPEDQQIVEVRFDINSEDVEAIRAALYSLNLCNEKITKLENSRFCQNYHGREFEVMVKFDEGVQITRHETDENGAVSLSLMGKIESKVPVFDQEDIDAFTLTYRQMIQDNDSISIRRIFNDIYNSSWMFKEAQENYSYLRQGLNDYLDSGLTLQFGENRTISRRILIETILYGGLAHTNAEKERIFRFWMESGFSGLLWAEFIESLLRVMESLLTIREVNKNIIKIFRPYVEQIEREIAASRN
jgi:hypothetical protein